VKAFARAIRRRARFLGLTFASVLGFSVHSQAQSGDTAQGELLLEVWINGLTHHELAATVVRDDGAITAECADLREAGLREMTSEEYCVLTGVAGVTAAIDRRDQRLVIAADNAHLLPQVISVQPREAAHEAELKAHESPSGLILNYDASAEAADLDRPAQSRTIGVALDLDAFTPWAAIQNSGFWNDTSVGDRAVRLESTVVFEDEQALQRISVGDTVTGDVPWSRALRIGGFQIARDFELQPDLVTQPLPQFFGESAVPSTLDVFVNGLKVFEGNVEKGPFELHDLPTVTGANEVTVVTQDVFGRDSLQTLSLYTSDQLLASGLTAYALDAGFVRHAYGVDSFDYREFVATATGRYGWTDWLTVEGHSEMGAGVEVGGVGATVALSPFGAASIALAGSDSKAGSGILGSAGFESRFNVFSFNGEIDATSGAYRDIAAHDGSPPPLLRAQLGANVALTNYGSLSASWIDIGRSHLRTQFATATYSLPLGAGYALDITGFHDIEEHASGAEVFLSIPLGDRTQAQVSTRVGAGKPQAEVSVTSPANPDGGFGYSASAMSGPSDGAEGSAYWTGEHISADVSLATADGETAARIGVSGSLIEMGGDVYAARRVDGAVALVDAGQPGVRVYQENREIAVTGENGTVLVTGLVPHGRNSISVSADDYPMDAIVSAPDRIVVPNRFGAIVNLAPTLGKPVLVDLQLPDGSAPPLGTHVTLEDSQESLMVGLHGKIFIHHLPAAVRGHVQAQDGDCVFVLEPPEASTDDTIPEIGPVTCSMEKANEPPAPPHT